MPFSWYVLTISLFQLTQPLVLCVGVKDISAQTVRGLVDFILSKVI